MLHACHRPPGVRRIVGCPVLPRIQPRSHTPLPRHYSTLVNRLRSAMDMSLPAALNAEFYSREANSATERPVRSSQRRRPARHLRTTVGKGAGGTAALLALEGGMFCPALPTYAVYHDWR